MEFRQELEQRFFESGVQELYGHWHSEVPGQRSRFRKHGEWPSGEAPDTWAYAVTVSDPLHEGLLLRRVITHSVLCTTAEMIAEECVDETHPFHPVGAETGRACANLVYCDSVELFDPHTIDEVLQVAVFGGLLKPHFQVRKQD